ncbi:MAG: protein kinase [Isosphaeraceae bacterium]
MSHRSDRPTSDPGQGFLGHWNLGETDDHSADLDDSLLAIPPPRRDPRPEQGRPFGGIPAPHLTLPPVPEPFEGRAETSDAPFLDFAFGQTDGHEADSLFAPEPAPPRSGAPQAYRFDSGGVTHPEAVLSTLRAGDTLSGFHLLTELGRGAFARVFLAEQVDLGHRRVALKVSRAEGDEPQILARLQHAHIVPIHSLHDDPKSGLRLLCMPYLGGANLAQVLETAVGGCPTAPQRLSLVDALDEVDMRFQAVVERSKARASASIAKAEVLFRSESKLPASKRAESPSQPRGSSLRPFSASVTIGSRHRFQSLWQRLLRRIPRDETSPLSPLERDFDQPSRRFLRQADRLQAAVWIVARLAEGLEHAHSRGLLHRDLKPSNVLIAGDGTPMLLDFNLSTDAQPADSREGEKAMLGGTLPYMSPEHLAAFDPREALDAEDVDERSDLYSLGLILFEMVAGEHPFPEPPLGTPLLDAITAMARQRRQVPSARAFNPLVPWSLESILRKCLDPEPTRRYARARELAEDLKRFLDDRPLRYAPEPSLRERAAKWLRRNPRVRNSSSIAAMATVLMIGLGGLIGLLSNNMQNLSARLKLQVYRTDVDECRFLLNHASGPAEHLDRGLAKASQTRSLLGLTSEGVLPEGTWLSRLDVREAEEVRGMATEVILMETRARVDRAARTGREADRHATLDWAIHWLDAAERIDPNPPAALYENRARYQTALGRADLASRDRTIAARRTPKSSRDFLLLGTTRLAHGELSAAERALTRASDLNPQSFWAWFTLGLCHLEAGRYADASGDFAACVAIEPRFSWPHLNRGLALARAGRLPDARACYEHALRVNPRFAEAWLNLALVTLELNDLDAAEKALRQAVALGRQEPAVLAGLAEVTSRQGNPTAARELFDTLIEAHPDDPRWLSARGIARIAREPEKARADLNHALRIDPRHGRAKYGLALLDRATSPKKALAMADAALDDDPSLIDALQLRALLRARLGDLRGIDDAERLVTVPTPHTLYNAACVFALLAETAPEPRLKARALGTLERALDHGFPVSHAAADPDLNGLHPLPEFSKMLVKAQTQNPRGS